MKDTSNDRFVAHIDILGMSTIVERSFDEAWQMLSSLVDAREAAMMTTLDFIDRGERIHIPEQIRSITFSDTIVLFTKAATDKDLRALVVTVCQIFSKALFSRVPIRIGIGLGVFWFNLEKSMYAGPALIDAYHSGETAQWLGIVFSQSLGGREALLDLTSGAHNVIVKWNITTPACLPQLSEVPQLC